MPILLLLSVDVTPINRKRLIDSSTYHTSEPALYLSIHIGVVRVLTSQ